MLKSPWMLLAVVPAGFLLLAAAAGFGPAQSVAAAEAFVGLAALALITGALLPFTFTFARRPAVPTLAAIRRFARDWVRDHPRAAEARAALARRFGGSIGVSDWEHAVGTAPPSGNPGDALAAAGLWHRFFPAAPARPEDIEAVLGELRGEGAFGQG